jgi:hypothetical protein
LSSTTASDHITPSALMKFSRPCHTLVCHDSGKRFFSQVSTLSQNVSVSKLLIETLNSRETLSRDVNPQWRLFSLVGPHLLALPGASATAQVIHPSGYLSCIDYMLCKI